MKKLNERITCKGFAVVLLTAILLCVSAQAVLAQSGTPKSTVVYTNRSTLLNVNELPADLKAALMAKTSAGLVQPSKEATAASAVAQVAKQVEAAPVLTRYTFTGEGSWFNADNWENGRMPPASLKAGEQVIIAGSGPCLYGQAKPFFIGKGSAVEVMAGKSLYLSIGNNFVLQGGTLTNYGDLTIISGALTTRGDTAGKIVNNGSVKSTKMSTIDSDIKHTPANPVAFPVSLPTNKQ